MEKQGFKPNSCGDKVGAGSEITGWAEPPPQVQEHGEPAAACISAGAQPYLSHGCPKHAPAFTRGHPHVSPGLARGPPCIQCTHLQCIFAYTCTVGISSEPGYGQCIDRSRHTLQCYYTCSSSVPLPAPPARPSPAQPIQRSESLVMKSLAWGEMVLG